MRCYGFRSSAGLVRTREFIEQEKRGKIVFGRGRGPSSLACAVLVVASVLVLVQPAGATIYPAYGSPEGADMIARAITDQPGLYVASCWILYPAGTNPVCGDSAGSTTSNPTPAGTEDSVLTYAYGPPIGRDFGILTSGSAALADTPNCCGGSGYGWPQSARGAHDVTILEITIRVPPQHNCLLVDFQFLSDEYPEYVGSSFNDAFVAEIDNNTWMVAGATITAPDNFAFDDAGNPITINAAGSASMAAANADGSTYDGGTARLAIMTPIKEGMRNVYFSIFDAGDHIFDSTVLLDDLRTMKSDPRRPCEPGVIVDPPTPTIANFKPEVDRSCGIHPIFFRDMSRFGSIWGGVGQPKNWTWDFGDGSVSYEPSPTHQYATDGKYEVTLTITDQDDRTDSLMMEITVVYKPCPPPEVRPQDNPPAWDPPRDGTDQSLASGDLDLDGIANALDVCPSTADPEQMDADSDRIGDLCDDDADNDGVLGDADNCWLIPNSGQSDMDGDAVGDVCDVDADGDTVADRVNGAPFDNCLGVSNVGQADADGDGAGDACDADVLQVNGPASPGSLERSGGALHAQAGPAGIGPVLLVGALAAVLAVGAVLLVVWRRK